MMSSSKRTYPTEPTSVFDTNVSKDSTYCQKVHFETQCLEVLWFNTCAMVTFFRCTILYNDEYCCDKGVSPNHVSSQTLVLDPFPTLKWPLAKNSSFTLIIPFQNGESLGFAWTSGKVFWIKYLLCKNSCQTPSLSNLKSHLLNKHLFLSSNTSIPRPPWSFGLQTIFYFVSLYFRLASSLCQKKRDL